MNEGKEIRFIDLFSGIGGFRLGFERCNSSWEKTFSEDGLRSEGDQPNGSGGARRCGENIGLKKANKMVREGTHKRKYSPNIKEGKSRKQSDSYFRCVWSCDNNKYANQVYTKRFGEENHYSGDIREVKAKEVSDFDLLCAGFPCQSFSIAGKRKGFKDPRGTLFFEILRIARAKRPHLLLLENVKGLLSHDRGETFLTILQELGSIGYWCEWQVFNSKHHGVPQNRERVFIIGHLGDGGSREVFPITASDKMATRKDRETAHSIVKSYWKGPDRYGNRTMILDRCLQINKPKHSFNRFYDPNALSPAMRSSSGNKVPKIIQPCLTPGRAEKRQHGRRFKENGEPIFTLTGQDIHGVYIKNIPHGYNKGWKKPYPNLKSHSGSPYNELLVKNSRIRRLTPVECERLQGFPDGWTEGLSDTQRYKCLGNAVTVNVIEFLGRRMKKHEDEEVQFVHPTTLFDW